ncbi:MAG: ATP synthase F1 subunit epsilon [Deltaproteobacteria bacterium]|nr:ATP synthase F1 subunit epsilon [Deltaproteobacteria bacterium]
MHLVVVTPAGSKVDASVKMVTVPGAVGELGIMPGHRALITSLAIGQLSYLDEAGKSWVLATNEGFCEIHDDEVVFVTESAEWPDDIDAERAKRSLDGAEALVKTLDPHAEPTEYKQAVAKRARALNRLAVHRFATPEAIRIQAQRAQQQ